jgi:hypothetical protein
MSSQGDPTIDFVKNAAAEMEALRPVYDDHVDFNDGVLPHVLMDEYSRTVLEAFERGEDTPLRQFACLLEPAMANPEVAKLIRTSFGESLDTYTQNAKTQRRLKQALGDRLYASIVSHRG